MLACPEFQFHITVDEENEVGINASPEFQVPSSNLSWLTHVFRFRVSSSNLNLLTMFRVPSSKLEPKFTYRVFGFQVPCSNLKRFKNEWSKSEIDEMRFLQLKIVMRSLLLKAVIIKLWDLFALEAHGQTRSLCFGGTWPDEILCFRGMWPNWDLSNLEVYGQNEIPSI